jgi:hypothetical protein
MATTSSVVMEVSPWKVNIVFRTELIQSESLMKGAENPEIVLGQRIQHELVAGIELLDRRVNANRRRTFEGREFRVVDRIDGNRSHLELGFQLFS